MRSAGAVRHADRASARAAPRAGHDGRAQGADGPRLRRPDAARRAARPAGECAGWRPLLESLSPADFGTIVGQVNLEFDQPKVAELLAKQLRGGVTAAHIIEANRKAAENQPPSIIAKLAPLCVDLHDNVDAIEAGLNQWDKVLSKRALRPEESV